MAEDNYLDWSLSQGAVEPYDADRQQCVEKHIERIIHHDVDKNMSQGLTFNERAIKHSTRTDMDWADSNKNIIKLSDGLNNHQAVTCLQNSFSAQRLFTDSFHTAILKEKNVL